MTKFIILGGFAGAGKTTIAKKLSAAFHLPLVSTDECNDTLRRSLNIDFRSASPTAHEVAWSVVKSHLKNGVTIILDTNMCNDRTWQNVDAVKAEMSSVEILPIILECSIETHRTRITHRGETEIDHLNLGGEALEDVLHKYEYIKKLNRPDLIRIDAEAAVDDVYRRVLGKAQRGSC